MRISKDIKNKIIEIGNWMFEQQSKIQSDQIILKGKNDLVSYVDRESEKKLKIILNQAFPEAEIIGEETNTGFDHIDNGYYWVVDPLDGTTNFLHHLPIYAISIGLVKDKQPILGIIYDPSRKEFFYAEKGKGAFLNDERIHTSNESSISNSLFATGFPYYDFKDLDKYIEFLKHLMKNSHGLRRMGAAAIDLAWVAAGRFEGFFEFNLKPWDVCAGKILVEEAGGKVTNFSGKEDVVFKGEIIAAGKVFPDFLKDLQKFW
jgi:myo-inositol-1(or 4)-monophosphatase